MTRHYIGAILGAALVVSACKGDPTSSLRGGPASLDLNPRVLFVTATKTKSIEVIIRDAQLNPLEGTPDAATSDAGVATAVLDTTRGSPANSFHYYVVTGVAPGTAVIRFTASGLKDSATVTVQ